MIKALYTSIALLLILLAYSIYSQDLKINETKEYKPEAVIYTKSYCQFCINAKKLLNRKDIHYQETDITWDKELHSKLNSETGQSTVPYIFINGKFIGGYQDLVELEKSNSLNALLIDSE